MAKKIVFYPTFADAINFMDPPQPAIHFNVPQWFRNAPKYKHNQTAFSLNNGENNLTIRHCVPLLEGFTSGYVLVTNIDLLVELDSSGKHIFKWIDGNVPTAAPVRSRPLYEELPENRSFPKMPGYSNLQFNWVPAWCIKTPKGYSSVFTHPINRLDLPFYTLGGIIDTDGWGEAGNHPFVLKEGWEGVIPKGTPYVQIIPFKRDNWKSEINTSLQNPFNHELNIRKRDSILRGWYKKHAWHNKQYR